MTSGNTKSQRCSTKTLLFRVTAPWRGVGPALRDHDFVNAVTVVQTKPKLNSAVACFAKHFRFVAEHKSISGGIFRAASHERCKSAPGQIQFNRTCCYRRK